MPSGAAVVNDVMFPTGIAPRFAEPGACPASIAYDEAESALPQRRATVDPAFRNASVPGAGGGGQEESAPGNILSPGNILRGIFGR